MSCTDNIDELCSMIASGKYKNIIVMTGAGISNASGIPDLHSISKELMNVAEELKLDVEGPEFVFDFRYFMKDPHPLWWVIAKLWPWDFKPKVSSFHYLIRALHEMNLLQRWYTTNVDGLEFATGIDKTKIVPCHGGLQTCHCLECGRKISIEDCMKQFNKDNLDFNCFDAPRCIHCGGMYVKPDVTLYGEKMPDYFFKTINEDFSKCDLLIVSGSSLNVQPFSSLISRVRADIPKFIINHSNRSIFMKQVTCKERISFIRRLALYAFSFYHKRKITNRFIGGDLQENAQKIANKLNINNMIINYMTK